MSALIFQVSEFSFNYLSLKAGVQYPYHQLVWQSYPTMSGDKEHRSVTPFPWCARTIIPLQLASQGCRHSCSYVHMDRRMNCWQLHAGVSLSVTGIQRRGATFCQGTWLAGKWKSFLKITIQPLSPVPLSWRSWSLPPAAAAWIHTQKKNRSKVSLVHTFEFSPPLQLQSRTVSPRNINLIILLRSHMDLF